MSILFLSSLCIGLFFLLSYIFDRLKQKSRFEQSVSDVDEITKLEEQSNKIQNIVLAVAEAVRNCSDCFEILKQTKFSRRHQAFRLAGRDPMWLFAKKRVLELAKIGFKQADKFLSLAVDRDVLLIREAFRYALQTCPVCPLAVGREKTCPLLKSFSDESLQEEAWISPQPDL